MLEDYNEKEKRDLAQILEPKISLKNNSPRTISTQISLDSKKSLHKSIKLNKPNKSPKIEVSNNSQDESILENYEIQLNIPSKDKERNENKYQSGKWTEEEHEKFIEGILNYGNEWKKVQKIIKTRSSTQARSHAQKFFLRIEKLINNNEVKGNKKKSKKTSLDNIINQILPEKFAKNLTVNQKQKLLSAISNNIKFEENFEFQDDLGLSLEEYDNINYKNNNNDNNVIIKNNKISLDLSILNANDEIFIQSNKVSIGQKRKLNKNKSNINKMDKILNIKREKDISRLDSFDLTLYKLNEKENIDDMNYLNNLGLGENDLIPKNVENVRKNSISSNNPNNRPSGISENKNNYIINNVINVTNNIISNKFVYNFINSEINNNCFQDFCCNDKIDSINNEKNQSYFGNFPNQEKYSFNDKTILNGNQFNKIFNYNFNMNNNNKDNDFNENENYNNDADPFQLNFNSFSNENLINDENDRQMSVHDNDFIKLTSII